MKRQLRERRILITGASSGIGRFLAEKVARLGGRVAVAARSSDKLQELADSLKARNSEVLAITADITQEEDRASLLAKVCAEFAGLDILVNNAGVGSFGHFADSSEEVLRRIMEVNFFAPAELIRLALPILIEGEQPAIVNVGSMCGRRGMPAWSEYSASKFALTGLTEALRGELARFDIDILLVLPGLTGSDFSRNMLRNTGRMKIDFATGMAPEEVADHIVGALQKNAAETLIGRETRWMLRLQKFFPRLLDNLIARRVRQLYQSH